MKKIRFSLDVDGRSRGEDETFSLGLLSKEELLQAYCDFHAVREEEVDISEWEEEVGK